MAEMRIMTGAERRRRYSDDEKRQLVEACSVPGANVTAIARRADVSTSLIYRWRQQLCQPQPAFAEMVVAAPAPAPAPAASEGAIEVLLGHNRIRIPLTTPAHLVEALMKGMVR